MFTSLTSSLWQPQLRTLALVSSTILVSIPVFFQAPLVRSAPVLSLVMTLLWLGLAYYLRFRSPWKLAGSLLFGFTLSWWCGSLYWGWLRTEPLWHLPVEALGFPIAYFARRHFRTGGYFYAGAFVGTALTDIYIWLTGLIPLWIQMMKDERPVNLSLVLAGTEQQLMTPQGIFWALGIAGVLLFLGKVRGKQLGRSAWSGAVLNTLLVNLLFGAGVMMMALQR